MDSQELIVMKWLAFAFNAGLLVACIWYVFASRRAGRPLPFGMSVQVLFIVGLTAIALSSLVGETAQAVLACVGGMLGAFAGVRMWKLAKQHLRDVGLVKTNAIVETESQKPNGQPGRAG
jgi:hypothetical protein